jgi:alpha-tubulin suppressor-like RCC1 family protein
MTTRQVFRRRSVLALCLAGITSLGLTGCFFSSSENAPEITQQPAARAVFKNQTARFSVGVKGKAPLAYQWRRDGVEIAGATDVAYTTPKVIVADDGAKFSVVITNSKGTVTSEEATLTVYGPPTITTDPASQTVTVGATAAFTVTAAGQGLVYQWFRDDIAIVGATAATFTTAATVAGDDGAVFTVDVANPTGQLSSGAATLTVLAVAAIVTPPASQTVNEGQPPIFSVVATGGDLTYQWRRNGSDIAGATAAIYTAPAATLADDGATFSVVVTNVGGSATSTDAVLSVASLANAPPPAFPAEVATAKASTPATDFTVVLKQDGTVYSWGDNSAGQRGDGTLTAANETPSQVTLPAGSPAIAIAVGGVHALALLSDGSVYAWGLNSAGQLGLGDVATRATPVLVTLPLPAVAIAAGLAHSVAVLNDGTVYAWGYNVLGEVGTGAHDFQILVSPVPIAGITDAVAVAAGNDHTLALLSDGTVVAWGANSGGQLGNGNFRLSRVPVPTGARDVARIRAGGNLSIAITNHRIVLAWGENSDGQLGRGAGFTGDVPTPTGVFADAVDAASGDRLLLTVGSDGLLRGAGANETGSLGDGTSTARDVFTPAAVLTSVLTAATGGKAFSAAVAADGSVYTWGDNTGKQLGNAAIAAAGTPTPTLVPSFDAIP